jgi:hypothetical protein
VVEDSAVAWAVRNLYVAYLMRTDSDGANTLPVRAAANAELLRIRDLLVATEAEPRHLRAEIERYLARPAGTVYAFPRPVTTPPGSPIGWGGDCLIGF